MRTALIEKKTAELDKVPPYPWPQAKASGAADEEDMEEEPCEEDDLVS